MSTIRFEDWEKEQLHDPEFQTAVREQEPAYQIARLRILRGLTQKQLADLAGTRQPSIARLESGKSDPDLAFLRQIAHVLGAHVEVRVVPEKKRPTAMQAKRRARLPISEPNPKKKVSA